MRCKIWPPFLLVWIYVMSLTHTRPGAVASKSCCSRLSATGNVCRESVVNLKLPVLCLHRIPNFLRILFLIRLTPAFTPAGLPNPSADAPDHTSLGDLAVCCLYSLTSNRASSLAWADAGRLTLGSVVNSGHQTSHAACAFIWYAFSKRVGRPSIPKSCPPPLPICRTPLDILGDLPNRLSSSASDRL